MKIEFFFPPHFCFVADSTLIPWFHLLVGSVGPSAASQKSCGPCPIFLLQQSLLTAGQEIHVNFLLPVPAEIVVKAQAYVPLQDSS